ncbi:MAG: PTS sugar transporter subunit IIA domain-containing protein [Gemmatimonadaceae bacterium]
MSDGPRAIVAAHGDLAEGLVSAVSRVAGAAAAARLMPFSNATLGGAELVDALRQAIASSSAQVVFTDLPAGSCTIAARRIARESPGLAVVCGANLPMLLAFVMAQATGPAMWRLAVEKGQAAMCVAEEGGRAD